MLKYIAEFFGTMIMVIFGNGAVANVTLKGTNGNGDEGKSDGWVLIAFGFGFAVMIPAMLFGAISGNHINPAVTIAQASAGVFPWSHVAPYIICQMLGAICGQLILLAAYWPNYKKTANSHEVFASFSTIDINNSRLNGFVNEFVGTAILMFGAAGLYRGLFFKTSTDIANLGVGFLVTVLVMALGGTTGPALNPARDLGPRLVYQFLPIPNKGNADWRYGWVPVVAPICGATVGLFLYKISFGL